MEFPYMKIFYLTLLLFATGCSQVRQVSSTETFPIPPHRELTNQDLSTEHQAVVTASSIEDIISSMKRLYSNQSAYRPLLEHLSSKLFQKLLTSRDPEVVMMTVLAAATCHHPLSLQIATLLIQSPYPVIQLSAIQALSSLDTLEANAMLVEALRSDYPIIRLEAGWFIAQKKSPEAFSHIDSLNKKLPNELLTYIPELYALEGSPASIQRLRQLLYDPCEEIVIETLLAIGRNKLLSVSDLLPSFKTHSPSVLEALAYSLQVVTTCAARDRLKELAQHPSPSVSLRASLSLLALGDPAYQTQVEHEAEKGDAFAIASLGSCPKHPPFEKLSEEKPCSINLCLAELMQRDPRCLPQLKKILSIADDQLLLSSLSLGRSLHSWEITPIESKPRDLHPALIESSLRTKEFFLTLSLELDETAFLDVASYVFHERLYELYPCLLQLIENKQTDGCLTLLKEESLRVGAPYNRAFATLGLIKITKDMSEKSLLPLLTLAREKEASSWRFPLPWTNVSTSEERTPLQQTTMLARLYIETISALADSGSEEAINILVDELSLAPQKYLPFVVSALLHATL